MAKDNDPYQLNTELTSLVLPRAIFENMKYIFIGGYYGGIVNIFSVEFEKFIFQLNYVSSTISAISLDHKDEYLICGT
jgi:hypothetical protein